MREIKFRVYLNGYMIHVNEESSYTICFGNEKPILNMFSNGGEFVCDQQVDIVEQFTGLLDSEGNEIYEGDIVKGEYFMPSQVIFKDGGFFFDDYPAIESISSEWLVIGNIHQNPELLDNDK